MSNIVDDVDNDDGGDDDIYIMMKCLSVCLFVTFLPIPALPPSPGFHGSRWFFWFQEGFPWFQVDLYGFSCFPVGFSWFQVGFHSFS